MATFYKMAKCFLSCPAQLKNSLFFEVGHEMANLATLVLTLEMILASPLGGIQQAGAPETTVKNVRSLFLLSVRRVRYKFISHSPTSTGA